MRKILSATLTDGDPIPNVSPHDGQWEEFFPGMAYLDGLTRLLDLRRLERQPEGFDRPAAPPDFFPNLAVGKRATVRVSRAPGGGVAKVLTAGRTVRIWFSERNEDGGEVFGVLFHIDRFTGAARQAILDAYGVPDPYDGATEEEARQIRDAARFEKAADELAPTFEAWAAVIPGAQVDEEER